MRMIPALFIAGLLMLAPVREIDFLSVWTKKPRNGQTGRHGIVVSIGKRAVT